MRSAPPFIACLACLGLALAAAAPAALGDEAAAGPSAARHYFVDFRARSGGIVGHTFIIYGRLDTRGRVLEARYAGLNPDYSYSASPQLAMPAYVSLTRDEPHLPHTAVYRRRLSAAEFARLHAAVLRLQATKRTWHAVFYNCNDFAAQLAREIGLWSPFSLTTPHIFVQSLQAMNGP